MLVYEGKGEGLEGYFGKLDQGTTFIDSII